MLSCCVAFLVILFYFVAYFGVIVCCRVSVLSSLCRLSQALVDRPCVGFVRQQRSTFDVVASTHSAHGEREQRGDDEHNDAAHDRVELFAR